MLQRKRENDLLKLRINNDFGFQKENFTIQKNESGNVRNGPQLYLINYDINSCKKSFYDSLDNSNSKLNNKINIITDDKKANLINTSIINNNSMKSIRYFNIIKNIMAIKNFGIKARTYFIYNHIQIKKIKESKINIDSDNINEIMEQLIN